MTARESIWARIWRMFWGDQGLTGRAPRASDGQMHYEILLEGREPIDAWSVCTVCLNVDRTASVGRRRWRCADCGSIAELQQPLPQYLVENPVDVLEMNLREWGAVKGVRPAYKMLKSARFKCLITLAKRSQAAPAST